MRSFTIAIIAAVASAEYAHHYVEEPVYGKHFEGEHHYDKPVHGHYEAHP